MKVIQFISGPGAGKSTLAASVFCELKKRHQKVAFVQEYATELVWENKLKLTENDQLRIFAEQNHRQEVLRNKVDFCITDTSLLLACTYNDDNWKPANVFHDLVIQVFNTYNNLVYFVQRRKGTFGTEGRLHNEQQSIDIDNKILYLLEYEKVNFSRVTSNEKTTKNIVDKLVE